MERKREMKGHLSLINVYDYTLLISDSEKQTHWSLLHELERHGITEVKWINKILVYTIIPTRQNPIPYMS